MGDEFEHGSCHHVYGQGCGHVRGFRRGHGQAEVGDGAVCGHGSRHHGCGS